MLHREVGIDRTKDNPKTGIKQVSKPPEKTKLFPPLIPFSVLVTIEAEIKETEKVISPNEDFIYDPLSPTAKHILIPCVLLFPLTCVHWGRDL